jgi:hypothetical protein
LNYLCYFLNQNTAYNTNIFSFQSIILYEDTPEFNGFNTRAVREQGILPSKKTSINYDQLKNGKPSNPSTVYTALLRMKKRANSRGLYWVVNNADLQLYEVSCQIFWSNPEQFTPYIPIIGGMHKLMNFTGAVFNLMIDSGLIEILEHAFAGVAKMASGKKYPQNVRALRMVAEEVL